MGEAKAQVVVAIRRRVVVAIRSGAVVAVVVPAAAAIHSVRAVLSRLPIFTYGEYLAVAYNYYVLIDAPNGY